MVKLKDWSHKWLNEGFATYMQSLFLRHDKGEEEFYYDLLLKLDAYLKEARERYTRPISPKYYASPDEFRVRHSYEKASLVIHSLVNEIGETT